MKTVGIVCEYNPFHKGHEYHIAQTRADLGRESAIVCVMSGDFVQRGEAAMFSKYARAEAACRSGADLVIELPLPWCLSSAEGFARGAVGLLGALGVENISFGSEAGALDPLQAAAELLCREDFTDEVKALMAKDGSLSFARARQLAARERLGDGANVLESPNNILAVEYLKTIKQLELPMRPYTLRRSGSGHDLADGEQPSAMELRKRLRRGDNVDGFMPKSAAEIFRRETEFGRINLGTELFDAALLSRLRMLNKARFLALPDSADGAGARLYSARNEPTVDGVLAAAKTKRFALSRLRRMLLCACLGLNAEAGEGLPPYARVLSANKKGCELLREISGNTGVPVITKPASVKALDGRCNQVFAVSAWAHDLFVLGYKATQARTGGEDWKKSPIIVDNN